MSSALLGLLGLAGVLTVHALDVRSNRESALYLEAYVISGDASSLSGEIEALPGASAVELVDRARARELFLEHHPGYEELFELFDEIPLPESYRVTPKRHWLRAGALEYMVRRLESVGEVDEVSVWAENLLRAARDLRGFVLLDLLLLLLLGTAAAHLVQVHRSREPWSFWTLVGWMSLWSILFVSLLSLFLRFALGLTPLRFYLVLPFLPPIVLLCTAPAFLFRRIQS
jgi:hypothetical protein